MAFWFLNHSSAAFRVSWLPAQSLIFVVKLSPFLDCRPRIKANRFMPFLFRVFRVFRVFRGPRLALKSFCGASFGESLLTGIGRPPDHDHTKSVNQSADHAHARIVATRPSHQRARAEYARRRGEAARVVGDACSGRTHARREKFRQTKRQPAKEQGRYHALREHERQE